MKNHHRKERSLLIDTFKPLITTYGSVSENQSSGIAQKQAVPSVHSPVDEPKSIAISIVDCAPDTTDNFIDDGSGNLVVSAMFDSNNEICKDKDMSINDDPIIPLVSSSDDESQPSIVSFHKRLTWNNIWNEMIKIAQIALPMAVTQLCTQLLELENLMFVGQLHNSTILAAAALASSYFVCLSWLASGLSSALDTLVSQAAGAKQPQKIGVAGTRGVLITSVACITIMALFWFAPHIFLLMKQEPHIAQLSGRYVRYLIPGLWPLVTYRTLTSFLVNQNYQKYPTWISISSVVVNIVLCYVLVLGAFGFKGLGFIGAPIACSLTRIIQLLTLLWIVYVKKLHWKSWEGIIHFRECIKWRGIVEFLKLGIPGMFMDVLDIWVFESIVIPAGILGDNHLAAHSVILSLYLITFMIPLGIGIGGSVRVGMGLGSGNPRRAKLSCAITVFMSVLVQTTLCVIIFALRYKIGYLYTSDERVIDLIAKTIPISVSFQIFDAVNAGTNGTIKGIGKQFAGFLITMISYWFFGFPLGNLLAFYFGLELMGLWLGLAFGAFFIAISSIVVIVFIVDWDKESKIAVERNKTSIIAT